MKKVLFLLLAAGSLTACVSKKQHDAVATDRTRLEKETQSQQKTIEQLTGQNDALNTELESLRGEKATLQDDAEKAAQEIKQAQDRIVQLNELINDLVKTNEAISNNSMAENARLARELKQNELLVKKKEAELIEIEKRLKATEADLEARDERDRNRAEAPLRQAEGAALLDTSNLTKEMAVATAIALVEKQVAAKA